MTNQTISMPDLRIVLTESVHPHESHDMQRSAPLIGRMRDEAYMINPPVVAPLNDGQYVVLDGANRIFSFKALGYPHILVQVARYDSGLVELATWQHVVCQWNGEAFLHQLRQVPDLIIENGSSANRNPIATIQIRHGSTHNLFVAPDQLALRNQVLRHVVHLYEHSALLQRTNLEDEDSIWKYHPDGIALVRFRPYTSDEVLASASSASPLPTGVSRHIVHGRAVRVNYPLEILRDENIPIEKKNEDLQNWLNEKVARRQVRYYAEATYQFDE
ncbi:MAG: hypothetical protein IAE89_11635 [Anaerolineae bacterium]|nr:hypothetical protein [Anaerolineae bacterium]